MNFKRARKAAGRCSDCGAQPKSGSTLCQICHDKRVAQNERRYKAERDRVDRMFALAAISSRGAA